MALNINPDSPATTDKEAKLYRALWERTNTVVLSRTTSLPGSPAAGDIYIIPTADPGGDDIAFYYDADWHTLTPDEGWSAYVLDDTENVQFVSGAWASFGVVPVSSVFGRAGIVVAATSDYDAIQIDFNPAGLAHTSSTDTQNAIEDMDAAITVAAGGGIPLGYLDTDGTLAANSDVKVATQKAVKTYSDNLIATNDAMVFKGVTDCSANPNYPAADRGHTYRVSVAGKIGGASGITVEVGDIFICLTDGTASGNQATVGSAWGIVQSNLDGASLGTRNVYYTIDGGGSAITTGIKGDLEIPFACTILQATLLADQSGSIVIDIWKDTYANYPPTVADTITASAKPTISATTKSQDATLTGWTTAIASGDILRFNVDSITTLTRVTLNLKVRI